MDPWVRYGLALVITIVVETGLACLLRRDRARRLLVDAPLINLFTHPLLHLGLLYGLPIPFGEVLVMAVESILYRRVTGLAWAWAIPFGIGLNAVTWGLGYVMAW